MARDNEFAHCQLTSRLGRKHGFRIVKVGALRSILAWIASVPLDGAALKSAGFEKGLGQNPSGLRKATPWIRGDMAGRFTASLPSNLSIRDLMN